MRCVDVSLDCTVGSVGCLMSARDAPDRVSRPGLTEEGRKFHLVIIIRNTGGELGGDTLHQPSNSNGASLIQLIFHCCFTVDYH